MEGAGDNNGFFIPNDKIDFSNVKIEPLFEEQVDFDTFSKSDFRAVKVKECAAVPKSKKLLQFTLDDGTESRGRDWFVILIERTEAGTWEAVGTVGKP